MTNTAGNSQIVCKQMTRTFKGSCRWTLRILRKYFVTGLILFVPFYLTLRLLWWGFQNIDNVFQPLVDFFVGHEVTGVGFAITVILIFVFGMLGIGIFGRALGRRILHSLDSTFERIPLVRHIYSAIKQVVEGFSSKDGGGFKQVVIVEFPRKGMFTLGLITNEAVDAQGKTWVSLYIPTPPNPTGGFFEIVAEEEIIRTDLPVSEGIKIIISSGKVTHGAIFDLLAKYKAGGGNGSRTHRLPPCHDPPIESTREKLPL